MWMQAMPGTAPEDTYDLYSTAAQARHKAVLWPIIMDGEPYSWVERPGTAMLFRILDPMYELHSATFYRDLLDDKVSCPSSNTF